MSIDAVTCQSFKAPLPQGELFIQKWTPPSVLSDVPVVLLHDSLGCVGLWRDFPAILAAHIGREVIAYDRYGFGQSSGQTQPAQCDFIWREADTYFPCVKAALQIKHYVLLGHSVGGAMAIAIGASDSDCQGVITEAAQAFVEDITIEGIKAAQKAFSVPGQVERLGKWHGDKASWVLSAWIDVWLSDAFADWSLKPCIADVTCPVLAIHGDKDEYGSKAFPEFISGHSSGPSQMVMLSDCGHVPHKEKQQQVLDLIAVFLT